MQSIKQVTDSLSVCGLYELSVYLSVHIVRDSTDDPLPKWGKRFDLFFYIFFLRCTPRPQHATHAATPISRRHALRSLPYPPRCRPSWSYQSRLPDPSNLPVQSPPPSLCLHGSMVGCPFPTATRRMYGHLRGRAQTVRLASSKRPAWPHCPQVTLSGTPTARASHASFRI
jgi:hypothetical protein